jgi:uncharacterized protein (TIGR03083 family)
MTDLPSGALTPAEYQGFIRRDADAFLDALAGVDPGAAVPACPDWAVRDLVEHLGRTHQWARLNASSGLDSTSPKHQTAGPAPGDDLARWYATCADDLLKVLAATDPAEPCWTFQPGNDVAGFWSRRQSHELAMHRNDLVAAAGGAYHYDARHAADGVGEVLDVFLQRRKAYGVPPLDVPAPVLLECADRPERWLLAPVPGDPDSHQAAGPRVADPTVAAAAIRGPVAGLVLSLWKRQDAAAAGLVLEGDADLAKRLLAAKLTP